MSLSSPLRFELLQGIVSRQGLGLRLKYRAAGVVFKISAYGPEDVTSHLS